MTLRVRVRRLRSLRAIASSAPAGLMSGFAAVVRVGDFTKMWRHVHGRWNASKKARKRNTKAQRSARVQRSATGSSVANTDIHRAL